MKLFCLVLTILLPFSHQSPIPLNDIWQEGDEMLGEMDEFRENYSSRGFKMFGDIKTNIMDTDDTCFSEGQIAFEWSSLIKTLLTSLMKVQKSEGTKIALNKVLDNGMVKLNGDLEKLEESLQGIDSLKSKTTKLMSELDLQYKRQHKSKKAKWLEMRDISKTTTTSIQQRDVMQQLLEKMRSMKRLHDEIAVKLNENIQNIDNEKAKLQDEIENIEHLKSKIDPIKTLLNSDSETADLQQAAQDLIDECDKFREIYNKNTNIN